MKIAIVNHGAANINSVVNMLNHIGHDPLITQNAQDLFQADKIILPGIGNAQKVWHNLEKLGYVDSLKEAIEIQKKMILGICVGMQLMTDGSDEGNSPGFGWIKGRCRKFQADPTEYPIKIPHMGWNKVLPNFGKKIFSYVKEEQKFYFVHSYFVDCENKEDIAASSTYGKDFVCSIEKNNIFGVQFHPEKSHSYGIDLLTHFVAL